jgi:hypothetical protein
MWQVKRWFFMKIFTSEKNAILGWQDPPGQFNWKIFLVEDF